MERRTNIKPERLEVMVENLESWILEREFNQDINGFSVFLANEMGFSNNEINQAIPLITYIDEIDPPFVPFVEDDVEEEPVSDEWEEVDDEDEEDIEE